MRNGTIAIWLMFSLKASEPQNHFILVKQRKASMADTDISSLNSFLGTFIAETMEANEEYYEDSDLKEVGLQAVGFIAVATDGSVRFKFKKVVEDEFWDMTFKGQVLMVEFLLSAVLAVANDDEVEDFGDTDDDRGVR